VARILERHRHPKYERLTLQRRSDSVYLQAVCYLDGELHQKSTRSGELTTALKLGGEWYRTLIRGRRDDDLTDINPTMRHAFRRYRDSLGDARYVNQKWSPIEAFWRDVRVADISAQTFREFFAWRRGVKPHTLHKDVVLVRQVLKYALEHDWLDRMPVTPRVGKIVANPRPWLTPDEWQQLAKISLKRIKAAAKNPKVHRQREELHEMMVVLVYGMMRVGELRTLRFRNCRPLSLNARGDCVMIAEVDGKRGRRTIVMQEPAGAVIEKRRTEAGDNAPGQLVFPEHHRDAFRELLDAAGLRTDGSDFARNLKSLRATAISFAVLKHQDLLLIARNAGTSVQMIDTYYAKRLSPEMHIDALSTQTEADATTRDLVLSY
jgi:hypothetical protein